MNKTTNALWPNFATSPMGKVQALLVPVTDDLYAGGASEVVLKAWADEDLNLMHCTFSHTVTYRQPNKSRRMEHTFLVNKLRSLGCRIDKDATDCVEDHRIYVSASFPMKNTEGAYVLGTVSQDDGAMPHTDPGQHELSRGRLSIKKLKEDYELHSLHASPSR